MTDLRIGFITWEPNYGDPKFTGAAQGPAPGSYTIQTIGGPRSVERIKQEIELWKSISDGSRASYRAP